MITRPAFKNKSVRDVIQSAVRVVEILGNSDLRNMIHGILELDADIKRFDTGAWIHFDQAQREVLVDIGNGVETLKDANARLDREEAARFRPIGISSTREELPALALIDEALTGVGAAAKQLGHGLPPRELYLSFLALDLPHHADWSLVMAQAAFEAHQVPVRLSLPMQVRNDLVVIGLEQPGNDIPNTIKPSAEAVGYFWFAWRPEPNDADH